FQGDELCGLPDTAFQCVFALQSWLLGADQSQYDGTIFGNLAQRLEPSRALFVIFKEEAVKTCLLEYLGDRAVIARSIEPALIVTAAKVQAENDSGMIANDRIVHFGRKFEKPVGIIASLAISLAQLRIQQSGVLRRVNLNVRASEPD